MTRLPSRAGDSSGTEGPAPTRTVGLVQASNEWPLLALSISHALMYHVDEVYLLNHSSTDGTYEGTKRLQQLWPGRLHVVEYHDNHFWQEACLSALIEVSQRSSPEWIYVFDADEFMIVQRGRSLREILTLTTRSFDIRCKTGFRPRISTKATSIATGCYAIDQCRTGPSAFHTKHARTRFETAR